MANGKSIKSINPATGETIAEIQALTPDEVKAAVARAREAQKAWARLGVSGRLPYFRKLLKYVMANIDDIAKAITLDNGKTLVESVSAEIVPVLDMLSFCINEAPDALMDEHLSHKFFGISRIKSRNIFEPLGVVAVISPWNFPFSISVTQTLMALITGNTVVLKPAALTAYIGEITAKMFKEAGLPEGVFNLAQGSGAVVGDALLEAGVDRIAFTGSVEVGKHLMKKAGEKLTPITLELGGKDPFVVLDDADLERAASGAVWGAFINCGQVCASVERVYVHQKVAKEFTELVVRKSQKVRVGNGLYHETDMGPMITADQLSIVESHIADAAGKGAKVLAGGSRISNGNGNFMQPTVLSDVNHGMVCMSEETFGPTLPIMVFSNDDEAMSLANDSKFALTASVWSKNASRAEAVAKGIVSGTVTVNDCSFTYGFAVCPWGGPKESGIGRTHSVHGLYEFTNIKNLTTVAPLMKSNIWWYPYSRKKYDSLKGIVKIMYGNSLIDKCSGVSNFFRK